MGLSISPLPEQAAERTRGPLPIEEPEVPALSILGDARYAVLEARVDAALEWLLARPSRGEVIALVIVAIIAGIVF